MSVINFLTFESFPMRPPIYGGEQSYVGPPIVGPDPVFFVRPIGPITLPTDNMAFADWFNQLRIDLPTFEIPYVDNEENWIENAEFLLRNPDCAKLNCPWPQHFPYWREWAQRFVASFGGLA